MADGTPAQPSDEKPTGNAPEARVDAVIDLDIDRELHESYLTYAMSTIMASRNSRSKSLAFSRSRMSCSMSIVAPCMS